MPKLFALSTVKRLAKFHTAAEGEKRLASNLGWAAQLEAEVAAGGDREFGARRAAALGLSRFADEVRDLERLRASAVAVGLPGTAETVAAEIRRFRVLTDRFEALAVKPWAEEPAEAPAAPAAEEPAPVPVCATCGGAAPDHVWEPGAPSPCCASCMAAEVAAVTAEYAERNAAEIAAEADRRAEKAARAEKPAGFATVEEALAAEGLRLGPGEAGWYVFVLVAGESLKVWATDLPVPETAPAPAAEEAPAVVAAGGGR
jgi:hypothetical protein